MKNLIYFFFIYSISIGAQEPIAATFIKKSNLKVDALISIDNFGTSYYLKNNIFYKEINNKAISYNNLQLGTLHTANAFNPLKINLFYKDFNTIIILDNRLAEIFKIDFNTLPDYKNVSHVTTGHDNTLWIFNQDLQRLELFDYKTETTRAQTVPVQSAVLDITSNFSSCFLLTEKYLYIYNYFGSLRKKIKNTGYTALAESNENIIFKKENALFFMKKNQDSIHPILTSNLLINHFFVTNESLYLYQPEILQEFHLKIK